jgi:DNA replication protein DnaC
VTGETMVAAKKKDKPEDDQPEDMLSPPGAAQARAAAQAGVADDQQESLMRRLRLRNANIPPRYLEKTLENFAARTKLLKEVVGYARGYAETFQGGPGQKGLFIHGCTGCGKSHIASAILKLVIERGFSGYWCNVVDLVATIRDVISRTVPAEDLEYIEMKCAEADLLVLDDLGSEAPRGVASERLYGFINRRYERDRPIIVTSNHQREELERQFQGQNRIMSRLGELCTRFAPFPDVDYRLKNLK